MTDRRATPRLITLTWTAVPVTLQAKTGVPGLIAGSTYYFRVQAVTRTGAENWSQIVALIVK